MDYKSYYINHYETIMKANKMLESMDNNYFTTTIINGKNLDENTVSIVMTSCNRSYQTYFTIDTISKSFYKNVQIILIDDSTDDFVSMDKLMSYNVHIELIHIKNKFWINPCVNYNIGFKHIKGGKIIIQNAEVCHVGDVINYVGNVIADNEYHVFNVYAMQSENENNLLHTIGEITYENQDKIISLTGKWYQHPIYRNAHYHFLTSMTKNTFNKIKGFDIDFCIGVDYDDDNFLFNIIKNNINILNAKSEFIGIHQWHKQTSSGSHSGKFKNDHLHYCKQKYYEITGTFLCLSLCRHKEEFIEIVNNCI